MRASRAFLASLAAFLAAVPLIAAPAGDELTGKIVGVHDGDTVTLLVGKQTYKIRLEGIDAPELGQPFGKRSKKALSGAIFGKPVRVETYGSDRYGRVIGRIYGDGMNVNAAMVASGWAWHYVKYSDSRTLAKAERSARAEKVGLWSDPHAMPPWEWRAAKRSRSRTSASSTAKEGKAAQPPPGAKYWLNTSSNVRHNSTCKYFEKTKRGRFCGPNDGKACGICGG